MNRILAAVDFSAVSEAVIERAASIARAFSAQLVLLHAAAPDPDFVGFEVGPQSVREARAGELRSEHRRLQRCAEQLRERGIDATALLIQGPTVAAVLEKAEQLGADLIVLGSHGHGPLHRVLLGSVSEGVIRRSALPVLVVPARSPRPEPESD